MINIRIIIIFLFVILAIPTLCQDIGKVTREERGWTTVYNPENEVIATAYTKSEKKYPVLKFSKCLIVIRDQNGYTLVYNHLLSQEANLDLEYQYPGYSELEIEKCEIVISNTKGEKIRLNKQLKPLGKQ